MPAAWSDPRPYRGWLQHWAKLTPAAPALIAEGQQLDYIGLATAVTARAQALAAAGLQRGERVALAATRRTDTLIELLAAVELGLCYTPLDPAYPDARLAAMLEDSAPRAVLGREDDLLALETRLGPLPRIHAPRPHTRPHAGEGELAYVLFTSGSTGRPKGVAMGPRPLAHLIDWHAAHPRLGQTAVTALFAPLSFDVHFQEIFSTLACGGCMVLLSEPERRDPEALRAALRREGVQRLFLPYVALQMLAEACTEADPPPLLDVISAGEQLQVTAAIRRLFARLPGSRLHNHYGPTETHVVTAFELEGDPTLWPAIPPIGRALPHVATSLGPLADDAGECNANEGELLLGGETLAAGYLGRAELSNERFIDSGETRQYRSGDRVRMDDEGVLHYLGRADAQLKIDGYRIEPGEIEVLLLGHPALRDAVVDARELPGLGRQLVAWVVAREGGDPALLDATLRAYLRERLPAYMQPLRYVPLPRLPTTPSGKIDRRGLPEPSLASSHQDTTLPVRARLLALWREALGQPQLDEHASVFDSGARSLTVLRVVAQARAMGLDGLTVAVAYDCPSVATQADRIERGERPSGAPLARGAGAHGAPGGPDAAIAIIGWALRAPGCADVEQFWQRLLEGYEGIRHFDRQALDPSLPDELVTRPNFVAARGVLEDADRFDAEFFGVSKSEATLLDPQQRLLLELAWTALEDAAIDPQAVTAEGQRIGVYAGTGNNSYAAALRQAEPARVAASGEFALMLASEKDYVATRIAHRLDLRGPAVSVHTACSTGLVAVAEAVLALRAGRCGLAIAGGASVLVPQEAGYLHVEGGMESADGHCRPFDADASGTVFSSAGAVVVLKPLHQALADGDTVHALIRGIGLNNDGAGKASFTAPSAQGQAECIGLALNDAGLPASAIGYVEAHGTGTALGDPIEVEALRRAYAEEGGTAQRCVLGSLKSNFGHTIAAAGVLGLIKAALCLEREHIPGTLHFRQPNPQIDFARTPFRVSASGQAWPRGEVPRAAAVSSFGVGGTNAHAVLGEAPKRPASKTEPASAERPALRLFPLSARSAEALSARAQQFADALERDAPALDAALATLVRGRSALPLRRSVVARDRESLIKALRLAAPAERAGIGQRLVFLFPGQGSQHAGMAAELHAEVPAFAEALDAAVAAAQPWLDLDLRELLLQPGDQRSSALLTETRYAQPALYCMEIAMAHWLASLGLKPAAVIGHSLGEYAAAALAGVMSVEDGARAVCARAAAMWAQARGSMLAVSAAAEDLAAVLPAGIEIVGYNAPQLCVLAGPSAAIDTLQRELDATGVKNSRLQVSHAFHSAAMDGALPLVRAALSALPLHAPQLPVYSCISGAPLRAEEATDPDYWARQVRAPVRFSDALRRELSQPGTVLVELGPGQALSALARQHRDAEGRAPRVQPLLPAVNARTEAARHAFEALGRLWCAGIDLHWPLPRDAPRARLPTYAFADQRFWFRSPASICSTPKDSAMADRRPTMALELRRLLADVAGLAAEDLDPARSLIEQGLDSLSLTQAALELERVFGVKLRFRRLMDDLDSIERLTEFLHAELPPERFAPAPAAPAPAAPATVVTSTQAVANPAMLASAALPGLPEPASGAAMLGLIQQQMALMQQQLAALTSVAPGAFVASATAAVPAAAPAATATATSAALTAGDAAGEPANLIAKPFGASARITVKPVQQMSVGQRAWLADFTARYIARSGKSRAFSQTHRARMADPRVVTGFHPLWKDLVYPIVAERSEGARVWDLDGNAYIDLLSCFGGNLLGYQREAIVTAMHAQIDRGLEVGPQHPLAAEVAELISEFTGHARVGFCNTGSEAVMGAMRIARTVTGRKTIAIFTNSYHGIFDEVIVRGTRQLRSISAAPGILANAVENVLVLDYASDEALRILRERGPELAAIMIEPVQNKHPTLQPREFIQALRAICDTHGCALIFDEVVTGFRLAPGGAQQFYGVSADICTYGKIIGGGLPFAAIAGRPRWLDALDGGHWQYGDDSHPEAGVTYFAGTFVRHPLALAAARATLLELKHGGQAFYDDLNARTQGLVERLNAAFAARNAPVKAVHCASLWRLAWDEEQKYVSLFYYLARFHGLHLYEQFGHFVTAAMGPAEIDRIIEVFLASLDELMAQGFIDRRAEINEGPLSPGQAERWLAAGFDPQALRALDETFTLDLRGGIDATALETALLEVCARHAAFRLHIDADAPRQAIDPQAQARITITRLDPQADQDAALESHLDAAAQQRFALGKAPMVAINLFWIGPQRAVLHLIASHLVFDGWAASTFIAELSARYRELATGDTRLPWAPAGSPFAFAAAEQARMAGAEGRESANFWHQVLASPPAPLELGDRRPAGARSFAADTARLRIEGSRFAALQALARQQRMTLFQTLLGVVASVLGRRAGTDDFVLSIPYASQGLGRHPALLSDGVLDLPLRLRLASRDDTLANLGAIRTALMDALEHPLMTQGLAARLLGLPSRGERPPLTGVYFNLNPKLSLKSFAPLSAHMQEGRKPGLLGELMFNFYEEDDALSLDLYHSTEFFSPARIAEILGAFNTEVDAFNAPMPPADRFDHIERTAHVERVEHVERIEHRFAEQAQRTPSANAIRSADGRATYAELDARANRIAHALIGRGVRPGNWVGLCLPRGIDLVAALLGVLKCGAAYVPLDPAFPLQRLRDMAEDAGLALLLSDAENAGRLDIAGLRTLCLDSDSALITSASVTAPELVLAHDAPAYVIYTSGSTGKPKGVVVLQSGVVNFLRSMAHTPGLKAGERLLAVTTLSFDIAVLELLLPLSVGAEVVLAQRSDAIDGHALKQLITQHDVHLMQATPSTWHLLLEAGFTAPPGFRALCGGEALSPALAKRLLDCGVTELWNMYGPTETTVWSTLARITDPQQISVGRPIDATVVRLLDEQNRECGVGEPGEICIGGAGVAQGYHARPELTAERFIADPFDARRGARLYRTGDLGVWNTDGTIRHMGRLDHQVKLRGYRIELGEIEAAIEQLPGIARAAMTVENFGLMDDRLVAYVVAAPGANVPALATMRRALGQRLPDYMLPQVLHVLPAMPLLPNGKIDRKALGVAANENPRTPELPATPSATITLETSISAAMGALLQRNPLHHDEHFFEQGGHSLLAAELATAIQRLVGQRPSLRVIFEAPSPRQLAQRLGEATAEADSNTALPALTKRAIGTSAPLSMQQTRAWFLEHSSSDPSINLLPSAHRLHGPFDAEAFRRALNALVARQSVLRTVFQPAPDGAVQVVRETLRVDCPLHDWSALPREQAERDLYQTVANLQAKAINLEQGPPFHTALVRLAEDEHVFVFVVHHLAWDGWSFDLLYREMATLYASECSPSPAPPAALALEYGDYCAWQRSLLASGALQPQIEHWCRTLRAPPAPLALPTDFPRPATMSGRGASLRMLLPVSTVEALHAQARRHGTTLFVVLLAAYTAMLQGISGQDDVVIGTPVRGREQADLLPVMGFFVNALPLRFARPASTLGAWIAAVQAVVTDALGHPDVPIEALVRELKLPRDPSRPVLFQAMFSFQDVRERPTHWGPLAHSRVAVPVTGATHDLNLWCVETRLGLETVFTYAADLFRPERIRAWAEDFGTTLERWSVAPSTTPLAAALKPDANSTRGKNPPRRRTQPGDAPLTPMQQRLIFVELSTPGGSINILPGARRLRGRLDVDRLREALRRLQQRHSALRTIFVPAADGMRQRIVETAGIDLPVIDLSHLATAAAESAVRDQIEALSSAEFLLDKAPLLVTRLFRLGRDEHVLAVIAHHLIADGRSMSIFYRDLDELYSAAVENRAARLPELELEFVDYAQWMHQPADDGEAKARIAPWLDLLADPPPPISLPLYHARPAAMSGRTGSIKRQLEGDTVERIRRIAERLDTTMFVVVLSTYFDVLRGLTGQSDMVIGVPTHGREHKSLAPVIGPFANVLPLRVSAPAACMGKALIEVVHARTRATLSLPTIQVDELIRALDLQRNTGRPPLYQTVVSYQDQHSFPPEWKKLDASSFDIPLLRNDSEIALWCTESASGMKIILSYATDLFDSKTAGAWLDSIIASLASLPARLADEADPQQKPAPSATFSEPTAIPGSNGFERMLTDVWAELLQSSEIGPDDNFFELGGHSLLALTMVGRVEMLSGKRLSLLRVGDSSLRALAAELAAGEPGAKTGSTSNPTPPGKQETRNRGIGDLLQRLLRRK